MTHPANLDDPDFKRGAMAAYNKKGLADQLTTDEILAAGGPDFKNGEDSDEPRAWHEGWDWAIKMARQQQ